jgi:tetratricopeptide (TPR) repeat protein
MNSRNWCCLLIASSFFLLPTAVAQPKSKTSAEEIKQAKEHFEEAEAYYRVGEYEKALEGYKEAYLLAKKPAILFNMAQCHRYLKHYQEALQTYQLFLADDPNTPVRDEVQGFISDMNDAIAALPKTTPQPIVFNISRFDSSEPMKTESIPQAIPKMYEGPKKNTFYLVAGATGAAACTLGAIALVTAKHSDALQDQIEDASDPNIGRVLRQYHHSQILATTSDLLFVSSALGFGVGTYFAWKQKQFEAKIEPNAVSISVRF